MSRFLLLYASSTGNTELMAEAMKDYLQNHGHDVVVKTFDFDQIETEELLDYDAVFIGTYTWDDGDLPFEVEDFYDELDDVDLSGKLFGVFGSADSFYDTYGGAIDLMYERLERRGATLLSEKLKVDLTPNKKDIIQCEEFAQEIVNKASGRIEVWFSNIHVKVDN